MKRFLLFLAFCLVFLMVIEAKSKKDDTDDEWDLYSDNNNDNTIESKSLDRHSSSENLIGSTTGILLAVFIRLLFSIYLF